MDSITATDVHVKQEISDEKTMIENTYGKFKCSVFKELLGCSSKLKVNESKATIKFENMDEETYIKTETKAEITLEMEEVHIKDEITTVVPNTLQNEPSNYGFKSKIDKNNQPDHVATYAKGKHFVCGHCNRKYTRKPALINHMRTHTGEKPFVCNVCSYKCTKKQYLNRHMKIHTGEKPFACNLCSYKCSRQHHLSTHMRIHTGEKPFECDVCDYKSSRKENLTTHMKTHTYTRVNSSGETCVVKVKHLYQTNWDLSGLDN